MDENRMVFCFLEGRYAGMAEALGLYSKEEVYIFAIDNTSALPHGTPIRNLDEVSGLGRINPRCVILATDAVNQVIDFCKKVFDYNGTEFLMLDEAAERLLDSKGKMEYFKSRIEVNSPRENVPYLEIGDFTYFDHLSVMTEIIDGSLKCRIGKFCSFGPDVTVLLGVEHSVGFQTTYPFKELFGGIGSNQSRVFSKGEVFIGNDVWIGRGATILSGVTIGDGCVVGANTVVTKSVDPYQIVVGNPGRVVNKRLDDDKITMLLEMEWWNWPYDVLYEAIPLLQCEDTKKLWEYYKEHIR